MQRDRESAFRAQLQILATQMMKSAVDADVERMITSDPKFHKFTSDDELCVELGIRRERMDSSAKEILALIHRFMPEQKPRSRGRR